MHLQFPTNVRLRLCSAIGLGASKSGNRFESQLSVNIEKPPSLKLPPTTGEKERERRERMLRISEGMSLYLKSTREQEDMMERERFIFDQGRRHLCNIMGFDPVTITQTQIDDAIQYLFPSGLFDKKAHPVMKPPEEIFPQPRKVDVDRTGCPRHPLFFTTRPKFYTLLSEINRRTQKLVYEYDKKMLMAHEGKLSPLEKELAEEKESLLLEDSRWLSMEELVAGHLNGEMINEQKYANLIVAMEYMAQLPNAVEQKDFIMGFRQPLAGKTESGVALFQSKIPKVEIDPESGRRFARYVSSLKATRMTVRITDQGVGELLVDGHGLEEFRSLQAREILLTPMIITGMLGKVDVEASIKEGPGGQSVIPRIVRHGTSLCLAALYPVWTEKLRLAGLLTRDPRKKERSKINQPGARAKWIWKKR